jgi:hypothetical protein
VQKGLKSLQAKEPGKSVSFTTVCLSVLLQKAKKKLQFNDGGWVERTGVQRQRLQGAGTAARRRGRGRCTSVHVRGVMLGIIEVKYADCQNSCLN